MRCEVWFEVGETGASGLAPGFGPGGKCQPSQSRNDEDIEGLWEVAVSAGAPREVVATAWSGQASAPDLLWRTLEGLNQRWLLVVDNADDARVLAVEGERTPPSGGE